MTNLVERIAETVRSRGVELAFGERFEADGGTVVPIALVTYGFGGGGGGDGEGAGSGAGGGGAAIPLGIFVMRDGVTGFHPNLLAMLVVLTPVLGVIGSSIARIVKSARR